MYKQKLKNSEVFILIFVSVTIVFSVLIGLLLRNKLTSLYNNGIESFERGSYEEAYDIFVSLGNWRDAPQMAGKAKAMIDEQNDFICLCDCEECSNKTIKIKYDLWGEK